MSNYKRLVSYMYNYESGIKRNNVGYARVESKNGQCKITIRITAPSIKDENLQVYIFKRNGYSMEGVLLGELPIKKGVGQFRTLTDSNNIMNSTYSLDEVGGLILYQSEKKYYASEWDDKPITREMVSEIFTRPTPLEDTKLESTISVIEKDKEEDKEVGKEVLKEDLVKQEEKEKLKQESLEKQESQDKQSTNKEEITESIASKNIRAQRERNAKSWLAFKEHPKALKIYNSFSKMYPFEDNEVVWCVRLEPQDIGALPMENWSYGNNSFLLHGFYCYSHLIFARISDKTGTKYIIGVPGIYHNREKFMARMFGFDSFKSIKRKDLRTGEFGYWYAPIYFN